MRSCHQIFRRGAVYYYRQAIRWPDGGTYRIALSLLTRRLAVARQRAIRLAGVAETVRFSLEHDPGDPPFTPEQRNAQFRRLLAIERDRLEALHLQVLDQVPLSTDREAFVCQVFNDLERFSQALVWGGMPDDADASSLGAAGLRMTELCLARWQAEVDAELQAQDLEDTAPLRRAMCKIIHQARVAAIRELRGGATPRSQVRGHDGASPPPRGAPPPARGDAHAGADLARSRAPTGMGWPGRYAREGQPRRHVPPLDEPVAEWAGVTVVEAASRYLASVPRAGGCAPGKRRQAHKGWDDKTRNQFAIAAMLLGKAFPAPIWRLQQDDLDRFAGLLDKLPAHSHHKCERHQNMSLEAIIAEAEALVAAGKLAEDKIGLLPPTSNRHFRFLRTLCTWVRARVPQMADLQWDDYILPDQRDARDQRLAFTPEQGKILFSLPVWTGCEGPGQRERPGRCILHDAAYWVPLLCWYSGGRREEIAKLLVDDIAFEDGIAYFNIDATSTGRIKNARSRRSIPLACELLRLGFLAYVEAVQHAGQSVLFPDLLPGKSKQHMGDVFYKRYWRPLARHLPFLKPGQALHAFRHMVSTGLKDAEVYIETRNDLLGHATAHGMSDRYSKATALSKLASIVEKIPIVTGHLEAAPVNICMANWPCAYPGSESQGRGRAEGKPARRQRTGPAASIEAPSPAKRAGQTKRKTARVPITGSTTPAARR